MDFKYSPMFQALSDLDKVLSSNTVYAKRAEQLLACVALARLAAAGKLRVSLDVVANQAGMDDAVNAGLPTIAVSLLSDLLRGWRHSSEVLHILNRLSQELNNAPVSAWDVLPYITAPDKRGTYAESFFLAQPVVDLMLDMLRGESGTVWVPFDASGQIAISALRRGYTVNNTSINDREDHIGQLLLCIETTGEPHEGLKTEVTRDAAGRPTLKADFVIAAPPFGPHARSKYWGQWELSGGFDPYDRAEAWAVSELLQRTRRRLIVFSSHTWLFSTGQEKRLRADLLDGPSMRLESVTSLPAGALPTSNIPSAISSFDMSNPSGLVRMSNLGIDEGRGRDIADVIKSGRGLVLGFGGDSKQSRSVNVQEIRDAEYVLLPQRLLNKANFGGSNTIPLGDICTAVRPTTPYRGTDGDNVLEIGIPNLKARKWNPIGDVYPDEPKYVSVKPREREEVFLRQDDILLSVKGTLGLARLISGVYGQAEGGGAEGERTSAVLSTSCVALRFVRRGPSKGITPVYLLMYLRSAEGQEQIRSLQVGAAMPHISVQSLLNTLRIPVPSPDEAAAVQADFEKLCALETNIEDIEQVMTSIAESRWLVKLA